VHEKQFDSISNVDASWQKVRSVNRAPESKAGHRLPLMPDKLGNMPDDANSSDAGMLRLVYKKARDIRQQRHLLNDGVHDEGPHSAFKELGKDLQHSIRVCRKAKDFMEMAMEGVVKQRSVIPQTVNESNPLNVIAQAENESPQSPISAKATSEWCELLDFLQAPTPKARHSCYGLNGAGPFCVYLVKSASKNSLIHTGLALST